MTVRIVVGAGTAGFLLIARIAAVPLLAPSVADRGPVLFTHTPKRPCQHCYSFTKESLRKHNICVQNGGMETLIHNRIAVFRAERSLTRKALAEAVNVNPQTIGFLERGDYKPSLELAMKIASLFGVPIEALFSFEPFTPLAQSLAPRGE